eukprot:1144588-Rhodomonas_salina.1
MSGTETGATAKCYRMMRSAALRNHAKSRETYTDCTGHERRPRSRDLTPLLSPAEEEEEEEKEEEEGTEDAEGEREEEEGEEG